MLIKWEDIQILLYTDRIGRKDAARRDFTINGMYLSKNGKIRDFFKGTKRFKLTSIIRFIGNIEKQYSRRFFTYF